MVTLPGPVALWDVCMVRVVLPVAEGAVALPVVEDALVEPPVAGVPEGAELAGAEGGFGAAPVAGGTGGAAAMKKKFLGVLQVIICVVTSSSSEGSRAHNLCRLRNDEHLSRIEEEKD